jgi:uncharacterized protein YceK
MKKFFVTLLIILGLSLSACSAIATTTAADSSQTAVATTAATSVATQSTTSGGLNTSYTSAVSVEYQLLVGTLKLEGTNLAVTKDEASVLLPMWQLLQSLNQSQMPGGQGGTGQGGAPNQNGASDQSSTIQAQSAATSAAQSTTSDNQSQIDAIVQQIEAAMTADQINAIANMQITGDVAQTVMSAQGITTGSQQQNNGGQQPSVQGTPQAGGSQGGQQPQGASLGTQQAPQGTPQAGGNGAGGNGGAGSPGQFIPSEYINVLIQMLQEIK